MAKPLTTTPPTTSHTCCPNMVVQEDYIDMDLTPCTNTSPQFEFQNVISSTKQKEQDAASPADELFYKGNLLPLHLPPRLQLVQKLLQEQEAEEEEEKMPNADHALRQGCDNVAAAASAKRYTWSKRLKLMKRWASRDYLKSLFITKLPTDANGNAIRSRENNALDQEELCHHRKSFSGIIRRVRCVAAKPSPLCSSSSSSSSSSTPSSGNVNGFFHAMPALKRSSSANSEKEGAIQGAIAHCKRSQQMLSARRSVSDAVFYSLSGGNSTKVSAASEAQERQEISRG